MFTKLTHAITINYYNDQVTVDFDIVEKTK